MNNNDDRWRISEQDAGQSHNYMQSVTQEEWSKSYQQNALKPAYLSRQSLATMAPMQMSAMPFMTSITSSAMNYSATPTLTTATVPTLGGFLSNNNLTPQQPLSSIDTNLVPSMGTSTLRPSSVAVASVASSNTMTFSNPNDKIRHAMNVMSSYVGTERPTVFPGITPLPTFSSSIQEGMAPRTTTPSTSSYIYSEERTSEHPEEYEYDKEVNATPKTTMRPTMRPVTTRRPTITTPPTMTTMGPSMTSTPTPRSTQGPSMSPTPTQHTTSSPMTSAPTPKSTQGPSTSPTPTQHTTSSPMTSKPTPKSTRGPGATPTPTPTRL